MNYLRLYINIIRKARIRQVKNKLICYKEKHHIIPKCLLKRKPKKIINGLWNIVELTAREHYICHLLLSKIAEKLYGKNHFYYTKLLYALSAFQQKSGNRNIITSRVYEKLMCELSKIKSEIMKNKVITDETRKTMSNSATKRGINNIPSFLNHHHSDFSKEKIKISNSGKIRSQETILKLKIPKKESHKKKLSESNKNKPYTGSNLPKPVIIDGIAYKSIAEACRELRITKYILRKRYII